MNKKSICILSFSPIYRDARVLRQIKYLSPHYRLTVIGYGEPHPHWDHNQEVTWKSIDRAGNRVDERIPPGTGESIKRFLIKQVLGNPRLSFLIQIRRKFRLIISYSIMSLGRLHPSIYEFAYWKQSHHMTAFKYALDGTFDAFHANDWEALPVAAEAARIHQAKLVFDAHEYAPLELENRLYWKLVFKPAITYFIKRYVVRTDATVTVAPLIAERYHREFGLNPVVILNSPEFVSLPFKNVDPNRIALIHHGGAIRDRELENMIKTLALCDNRFSLHFMLLNNDLDYLHELRMLAWKLAPDRILFHDPVPTHEIVQRISEYDMGFYLLPANSYNNLAALPNKFFDYIVAGLAVCVGPLPSMAEMVNRFGFGCVAPSFNPHEVSAMLNRLTEEQLSKMRLASRDLSKEICAEKEMSKLIELYNQVLDTQEKSDHLKSINSPGDTVPNLTTVERK